MGLLQVYTPSLATIIIETLLPQGQRPLLSVLYFI